MIWKACFNLKNKEFMTQQSLYESMKKKRIINLIKLIKNQWLRN